MKPILTAVLLGFSCVAALAQAGPPGLTHRYSFTANGNDSIGTAHGVLVGGASISGGALVLDGASGYVNLPNDLLTAYGAVSFETWVTDNGSGTWARIFDFGNSTAGEDAAATGTNYMFLSLPTGSGNLRCAFTPGTGGAEQIVDWPGGRPAVGQRAHIVIAIDDVAQTALLYVNGALVGQNLAFTLTPAAVGTTFNDWIGRSQWSGDAYFKGSIDEFRIYDIALSSDAVATNFQAGPDKLLYGPVVFVAQPQNQSVIEGRTATFTADVDGAPPFSLQWYRNNSRLAGETNAVLNYTAALTDNGAVFRLWATNTFSSVTYVAASSNAVLSVSSDTNPPVLLRAQSRSTNGVELLFSEPIRIDTATNLANYSLTGPGGAVSISSATLDSAGSLITLTTATLTVGSNYTITLSNLRDRAAAGNPIAPGTQATFVVTPYVLRDIGGPALPGGLVSSSNYFGFTAAGSGVGGTADQFSFAYETRTGDFDVQLRLGALAWSDTWAAAGLMARDGLSSNAMFAASFATPGLAGAYFQCRTNAGGTAAQSGCFPVNYPDTWLRLKRAGNLFTGYASLDGGTWTLLGSVTLSAPATLQVGIAVSSHAAEQPTFASVAAAGNTVSPTVGNAPLPFEPPGPSSRKTGLVISEIMYHPPGVVGVGPLEFVEIYNSDISAEDLTGWRLSGDIDYAFAPGTTLPSGGYLVVARDPAAVQSYYGISGVLGPFTNNLPNDTGTVRLRNEFDSILLEVNYDSRAPWPVSADGAGHSLVLRRPSYGESDPRAWAASDVIGGSPGRADGYGYEPRRGVVINEILTHTDWPELDSVELYNPTAQPINLTGCMLTDDPATNKYVIGNVTVPARGFVYFTELDFPFRLDTTGETLYLKNPAATRVLDAVHWDDQENGVSIGRYPDGGEQWYRLVSKTFGATNSVPRVSQVGINEIMYHPISGDDDLQYIELYNRGPGAVNLSGWKLKDAVQFTIPTNTMIPANGYLVIAKNAARLMTNYPNLNTTNTLGDFTGKLSHRRERIALSFPETTVQTNNGVPVTIPLDIVVDEVTYHDGGRWGQWSDGGGSSLELIDPRSDKRFAANWADSDESAKAPWTLIERTDLAMLGMSTSGNGAPDRVDLLLQGAGECLVDEVECRSNGGTNRVANPGFESGTSGWAFQGNHNRSTVDVGGAYAGSQALHLRATGDGDSGANRIRTAIELLPVDGANQVTLRARVRWLRGEPNILLRTRGNWLECPGVMTLPANLGTPGAPNSRLVANAGPAIADVQHWPILPEAGEAVVVSARVTDPDGVAGVQLKYRIDPSATYATVIMTNDHGVYRGTIPGQPSAKMVAFVLSATDANVSPATTVFPAAVFPPGAAPRECLVNFGETQRSGSLGSYRLWLTQTNLMYWNTREKQSNDRIDATFVYGNWRAIYNAGSAYSGSPFHTGGYNGPMGSSVCNYLVDFPSDDAFLGTTDFLLEGQGPADGSIFGPDASAQAETLAHWMGRKIGVRPDNRRDVLVYVNGQQRGMIYYDYQKPRREVVEEFFPEDPDGRLHYIDDWFEFDDAGAGFSYITATLQDYEVNGVKRTERYRWSWEVSGNPDDFTDLFALVDAVNAPRPEPYTRATLNLVNVPQWARMFALQHMAGDWDSYGYERGKNMYAYKPTNGPWELLLWDIQLIFGKSSRGTSDPLFSIHDPVIATMLSHPPFQREYWAAFADLVNGPMLPQNYQPRVDERVAALRNNGVPVLDPTPIKTWIAARRAFIAAQIPPAAFAVTGGTAFTSSSNNFTLTGLAPVGVGTILVNGAAYPLTWTSVTTWSLNIPLTVAGTNTLAIQAMDRDGNVAASTNVTVNYTGTVVPPEGNVVFNEIMYRPATAGGDYIELLNTHSSFTFDLSGWSIDGLDYVFPPGSSLPPRGFLVVAENPYTFAVAYGGTTPVFGQYGGKLDKDGETLTLLRPVQTNSVVVDRVRYETNAPWSATANLPGKALQLIDAAQDNSRVSNWSASATNQPTSPQWVYVTATGTASSSTLYIYLQAAGDLYLDDVRLVAGSLPDAGPNLIANGDFESSLTDTWSISADFAPTVRTNPYVHGGSYGLHLIATAPGSGNGDSVQQTISPALTSGATYTLSYWYRQSTNNPPPLTIRLSGSGINSTITPSAPAIVPPYTPGATNGIADLLPAYPALWLNEVQADNLSGITDNFGECDPWVELYNAGTNAINLSGFYLSSGYANLTQWAFPASTINPGQFLVVWVDGEPGQTSGTNLHANFRLPGTTGSVALSRLVNAAPQIVDYLNYANVPVNRSYGDVPDGQPFYRGIMYFPSPRQTNSLALPPVTIYINEWMADNTSASGIADPADGDYEDWFELYNPGGSPVDLGTYWLTDNLTNKFQYQVPNNGHYVVPANGYLLVWADNETGQNSTNRADLHVNFALSKNGEAIGLFAPDGTQIDAVVFGPQTNNVSQGRYPDGVGPLYFMPTPTPRQANVVPPPPFPPQFNGIDLLGGTVTLNFNVVTGRLYRVEFKDNLNDAAWTPLGLDQTATNNPILRFDSVGTNRQRFYRVVQLN